MNRGTTAGFGPYEIALVRGGPDAAVTVAVLALHLRGAADAGRPGTIRATEPDTAAGQSPPLPPLAEAVLASLAEPAALRELAKRPKVRAAVAALRAGLAEAGLLRRRLPGPTRAARRRVRELGERHPLPASRLGLTEDDKLLAAALHGEAALRVLAPRFALRAGLTERVDLADKGLPKHSRSAGSGIGGYSCNGGYSCGGGVG
ncbi:TIGR04222 domain-containing membrane protein [Streptomyces glaucus]|uniref:TIGR04222 domain-containing membrane protein n=1 Tax=Streptomyces glaucus TaxID=284029 RepID=A0ABP5X214_9ACTN